MEDYEKSSYRNIAIIVTVAIIYFLIKHISFDTKPLKYVDMEPFSEPIQENIVDGKSFKQNTSQGIAEITPLANYKIYGRVYAKHYRPSRLYLAAVFPYDVSIGFGDFQYREVYDAISVNMAGTYSYYSYSGRDYEKHLSKYFKQSDISHCFTNNHLCPANKNVKRGIASIRKKDIVYLEGYLIKFTHHKKNGQVEAAISSTSRDDNGGISGNNGYGSCEQIYVTKVVTKRGIYK